jgi:predicted MFS family arabinose efflux permease
VTSAFLGFLLGWRNAFLVCGIAGIGIAMLDLLFVIEPEGPQNMPGPRRGYWEALTKIFSAARLKLLTLVFLIVICSGALWSGVSSFIVAYTSDVKGIGLVLAGGLATISYTIGGLAQLIGGELSDRQGRPGVMLFGFGAFALFLVILTMAPSSTLPVLVILSVLGFTFYLTQSPVNALIGDISHDQTVGVTYGTNFAMKYGIGSFSTAIAGYLATRYSLGSAFYFFAAISALCFILTLLLKGELLKRSVV